MSKWVFDTRTLELVAQESIGRIRRSNRNKKTAPMTSLKPTNTPSPSDRKEDAKKEVEPPLHACIDVEAFGNAYGYPVVALGLAYGRSVNDIKKRRFTFMDRVNGMPMERRCYEEFWSKQPALFKEIQNDMNKITSPIEQQWQEFVMMVDWLHAQDSRIAWVSDNPSYDLGKTDYHVYQSTDIPGMRVGRAGVRFGPNGEYRKVKDPTQRVKALGPEQENKLRGLANTVCKHDHRPENDAHHILALHFFVEDAIRAHLKETADLKKLVAELEEEVKLLRELQRGVPAMKASTAAAITGPTRPPTPRPEPKAALSTSATVDAFEASAENADEALDRVMFTLQSSGNGCNHRSLDGFPL